MLAVAIALLAISLVASTRAGRRAARERLRPIERVAGPIALALWAWIIWAIARGPPAS